MLGIYFAISLSAGGYVEVRDNGNYRRDTPYRSGDVFRVAIEGGAVKYYKNGVLFHTSTVAPIYRLTVDASLSNLNATISSAVIGMNVAPTPTPIPNAIDDARTFCPSALS
ncbi:MAG: hypothetical protein H0V18_14655 [Pyrinomonadaceae bacterium]|nr:hypothetical protein [Pyrinomonadaceae bacterium]